MTMFIETEEFGPPLISTPWVASTRRFQFSFGLWCGLHSMAKHCQVNSSALDKIWVRLQVRNKVPQMEFLLLSLQL